MNEKRLAAETYDRRNDPDEWGEPETEDEVEVIERPKRRLSAMVSVRLSPEELEAVQKLASAAGITVSAFVRQAALTAVEGATVPRGADFLQDTGLQVFKFKEAQRPRSEGSRFEVEIERRPWIYDFTSSQLLGQAS